MHRSEYLQAHPEHESLYDDLLMIMDLANVEGWLDLKGRWAGGKLAEALHIPVFYDTTVSAITEVLPVLILDARHSAWFQSVADALNAQPYPQGNMFQNNFRTAVLRFNALAGQYEKIHGASSVEVAQLLEAYTQMVEVFNGYHTSNLSPTLLDQMDQLTSAATKHNLSQPVAKLYQVRAHYYAHQGDSDCGESYAKIALNLYGNVNDLDGCADAACTLAVIYRDTNRNGLGDKYLERVREHARERGYSRRYGILLYEEGVQAYIRDVFGMAQAYLEEALTIFEDLQAPYHIAIAQTMLGMTALHMKRFEEAETFIAEARVRWQTLGNSYELANLRFVDADLEFKRGDLDLSRRLLEEAREMALDLPTNDSRQQLIDRIDEYRWKYL